MVTAKKISTPKPAAVAPVTAAKPVATKKPAAKKTVQLTVPTPAVATAPDQALSKPKDKAAKSNASSTIEPAAVAKPVISAEQRNNYVEVAAFYIAERRGFAPGNPADDWCAAESEVDRLLASGQFNS